MKQFKNWLSKKLYAFLAVQIREDVNDAVELRLDEAVTDEVNHAKDDLDSKLDDLKDEVNDLDCKLDNLSDEFATEKTTDELEDRINVLEDQVENLEKMINPATFTATAGDIIARIQEDEKLAKDLAAVFSKYYMLQVK